MNIVILDDYQDVVRQLECFRKLDGLPDLNVKVYTNTVKGLGQLAVRLRDADVLVLIRERTHITKALLDKLPQLKLIVQTGKAGPHIDMAACAQRGIPVADGSGSPVSTAELTWALIMSAMRRLPHYMHNLRRGLWQQSGTPLGASLRGRTLGIWGYGKIGQLVAGYGKAFGMKVVVWGSEASRAKASSEGLEAATSREDFFAQADVLTLHLRLNDATRHLVTAQDLARMKSEALLVNTSRAELIEPEALLKALQQGRPGLAAVDVFENEPIAPDHPLLQLPNCICTPHLGYVEQDSYELYFGAAFDHIRDFVQRR